MTAQFKDSVILKKSKEEVVYDIVDVKGGSLFKPLEYGFTPHPTNYVSACLKGFLVTYIITDSDIRLKDLYINADETKPVTFNGVEPIFNDYRLCLTAKTFQEFKESMFSTSYKNVNLKLTEFSGSLLLGIEGKFEDKSSIAIAKTLPYGEDCYGKFIRVEIINGNVEKIDIL